MSQQPCSHTARLDFGDRSWQWSQHGHLCVDQDRHGRRSTGVGPAPTLGVRGVPTVMTELPSSADKHTCWRFTNCEGHVCV